ERTGRPSSVTAPALGARSPDSAAKSVDLPAPLGPTRVVISPARISRSSESRISAPPSSTCRPRAASTGGGGAASARTAPFAAGAGDGLKPASPTVRGTAGARRPARPPRPGTGRHGCTTARTGGGARDRRGQG